MKKVWQWKYRNHALCFIGGFVLAVLLLTAKIESKTKQLEIELEASEKITDSLKVSLKNVLQMEKKLDEIIKENKQLLESTKNQRKINFENGKKQVNSFPFEPNDELQLFITRWARQNGGNLAE
jgi:hypothetical protein